MADSPKNVEDIAKTAPSQEKKEEKKPLTTLENLVDETGYFFGNALKIGLAGMIPYASTKALPQFATDTYILSGAQVASDITTSYKKGKKYTAGSLLESAALGTGITPFIEGMFGLVNRMPLNTPLDYLAKAGVWGGIAYPGFIAAYQPMAYLIRNRTFKGLGTYVKTHYWKTLKDAWKKLLPFSLLNVFFAPSWLQIPISAALSYVFDLFGAPQKEELKEEEKKDKTPYYKAAASVTYKLAKNSIGGIYDAFYSIGSGLNNAMSYAPAAAAPSAPKPASPKPKPAPAAAPAHAPAH
ncbi:hypothetical protein HYS31_05430 [Candidatus Woesearchaeota archaeon]|nr:hypothetical protein [Candidatus Woesearchaeota archaeon]